jgi:mRNA interferase MazF
LDPTPGSEIQKARPCLVVSPDELNRYLRTVIIAPMTTAGRAYPWRVPCRFQRRSGFVALDQLRTVDAERLLRPLGRLTPQTVMTVLRRLQEMFAE